MKRRREDRRQRGAMLAEAAIVFTLLLMVTLAAFQYGWLFLCAQRVTNATRQGARMEAVLNAPPGVELTMEGMVSDLDAAPDGSITTDPTTGMVTATLSVLAEGNPKVQLLNIDFLPVPATLRAEVTMAKEGQFTP